MLDEHPGPDGSHEPQGTSRDGPEQPERTSENTYIATV